MMDNDKDRQGTKPHCQVNYGKLKKNIDFYKEFGFFNDFFLGILGKS